MEKEQSHLIRQKATHQDNYWLIYLGIVLTMLWEVFPKGNTISYPLVDHSQDARWWAYLLGQHLNVICLALFMYLKDNTVVTQAFLVAHVLFMFDYLLRYNMDFAFNINYNHIIILIMAFYIWGSRFFRH